VHALRNTCVELVCVYRVGSAAPQRPALHDCPAGHVVPHAPQFVALVCVSTHAPEQTVCPAGHVAPHVPAAHVAVPPLGAPHALPQRPQCARVVLVLASQPLAALLSQSPKPALHINEHAPALQAGVPLAAAHAFAQRPQCATLDVVSVSQPLAGLPSQSAKPAAQRTPHAPAAQVAVALAAAGHALPQRPQCAGSV
jgi:hypothetical protein